MSNTVSYATNFYNSPYDDVVIVAPNGIPYENAVATASSSSSPYNIIPQAVNEKPIYTYDSSTVNTPITHIFGNIHIGVLGFVLIFFFGLIVLSLLFVPHSGLLLIVLALLFLTLAIIFSAQASTFLATFFILLFLVIVLAFIVFALFKGATVRLWWANVRASLFESERIYPESLGGSSCDQTEIVAAYNDARVLERTPTSGHPTGALIFQFLNKHAPGGAREDNLFTLHQGE